MQIRSHVAVHQDIGFFRGKHFRKSKPQLLSVFASGNMRSINSFPVKIFRDIVSELVIGHLSDKPCLHPVPGDAAGNVGRRAADELLEVVDVF